MCLCMCMHVSTYLGMCTWAQVPTKARGFQSPEMVGVRCLSRVLEIELRSLEVQYMFLSAEQSLQPYLRIFNHSYYIIIIGLASNYNSLCLKIATWYGSFWKPTVNVLFKKNYLDISTLLVHYVMEGKCDSWVFVYSASTAIKYFLPF